jgi:hypothetical protein
MARSEITGIDLMKSLGNPRDRQEILDRLSFLQPNIPARWGSMSCPQMVCHLSDSFRVRLGEKTVASLDNLFTRTALKWAALYLPVPWPHGFKAPPEIDQRAGGTRPQQFERDVQELRTLFERFVNLGPDVVMRHPYFGPISEWECLRWAYLHMDHHLRQFGA